ncbi:MAG TPA: tetratricopeptide repeat protein [Longimicrobiales bacterium]
MFSHPARSAILLLFAAILPSCSSSEDAITRGDRLWADSAYSEAIAEYQLAYARGRDTDALRRLAHAYAVTGQFDRAHESYETLLADDPESADQAAYDFVLLAQQARARGDGYGVARAAEAALELRPGLELSGLTDQLASYYEQSASPEQAIAWYERAIANAPPDSAPALMFRLGDLLAERRDCTRAQPYLRGYLSREPRGRHADDARYNIGNCAYEAARAAHQGGDPELALRQIQTLLDLGQPSNLLDEAWFMRGDILFALGRNDEALAAYQRVLDLNPARTGQLVDRAQRQIDIIRFGTM